MFDLKKPCKDCPFKIGQGSRYRLRHDRLLGIFDGPAFQCHRTIDYDQFEDSEARQGDKPQQCAGLMGLLLAVDQPNQIMQVAMRLGHFDPGSINRKACYQSFGDAMRAHIGGVEP